MKLTNLRVEQGLDQTAFDGTTVAALCYPGHDPVFIVSDDEEHCDPVDIANRIAVCVTDFKSVMEERDQLRGALKEMVELKDLRDKIASRQVAFKEATLNSETVDLEDDQILAMREIYNRRKPIAWETARRLVNTLALLLTLAGSASSQNARVIFQHSNCDIADFSWSLVNQQTGDTVLCGGNYFCFADENIPFQLDPGIYSLQLINPVVSGQGTGMFILQVCEDVWFSQLYPFPQSAGFLFSVPEPIICGCPETPEDICPADVNDDGIVGVADLLIFIAAFGMVCD